MENYFHVRMEKRQVNEISALGLAHIGDGVFELLVRVWLSGTGKVTPAKLHKATVRYVSAGAQSARVERLLPLLSDDEMAYYKRGRNAHAHHTNPKNATPQEYARATGLETLFGALYLLGARDRINELFVLTMEENHAL